MAVIVTFALAKTLVVFAVNVTYVALFGTVTVSGTITFEDGETRVTTSPPAGAGPFIVIFPVEEAPPITEGGMKANAERIGA
jgi:hypothetical protein